SADEAVDLGGRAVLPGWVDSHSHLVLDGDRAAEFEARMAGESYSAAGIGVTTDATRAASDQRLRAPVRGRSADAGGGGTATRESKSGYGLTAGREARAAQLLACRFGDGALGEATVLGARRVPSECSGRDGARGADDYVDLVSGGMLTAVAPHVRRI